MRLHLPGDAEQAGVFSGDDCDICKDPSVWKVGGKKAFDRGRIDD